MHSIPHSKTTLQEDDFRAVQEVLHSGMIISGTLNKAFEEALREYLGQRFVKLYSSGTSALFHILKAMRDGYKKKVLVPNYICWDVLHAIVMAGYTPVLYDNEPKSWLAGILSITRKIEGGELAIIVNHTFGMRVRNLEEICRLGIPVIEDCCHALVPQIHGQQISHASLCSFYSFQATKLIATGEGGAVATSNVDLAEKVNAQHIDHGLADLNCALGLNQLKKLPAFLKRRQEIAEQYSTAFPEFCKREDHPTSVYFRFPIYVDDPSAFSNSCVSFKRGVDKLLHHYGYGMEKELQNSVDMFDHTISLPIYPSLADDEVEQVIREVQRIIYGS